MVYDVLTLNHQMGVTYVLTLFGNLCIDPFQVVTRTGVGKLAIAPFDVAVSQDFTGIIPNEKIKTEFLFWLLNNSANYFLYLTQGTSINGITRKDLMGFVSPIPPLPEQHHIATILSTIDSAIEQTEAIIAKQQRIKTGLMQDLLTRGIDEHGSIRSEETHEFKDSPLGRIPVEWEVEPFGSSCERVSVGIATSTTKHFRTEGVPLLRNQNVLDGHFDLTELLYISSQFDEVNKSKRLRAGDLVTMRTGYPGRTAVVSDSMVGWQTFTTLISTPKQNKYISDFLCLQMNSYVGRKQIMTLQGGGAQQNLNVGWVVNMQVLRLSISEQKRIIVLLTTIDRCISGGVSHLKRFDHSKPPSCKACSQARSALPPY